jgi:hypothetical protein
MQRARQRADDDEADPETPTPFIVRGWIVGAPLALLLAFVSTGAAQLIALVIFSALFGALPAYVLLIVANLLFNLSGDEASTPINQRLGCSVFLVLFAILPALVLTFKFGTIWLILFTIYILVVTTLWALVTKLRAAE